MTDDKFLEQLLNTLGLKSTDKLKLLTIGTIIIFSVLLFFVFILPLKLCSELYQFIQKVPSIIGGGGSLLIIIFLLSVWIFSGDNLYYTSPQKNKYANAFQKYWTSTHIARKFNLAKQQADYYWSEKLFNTWADSKHPRHLQWERTFQRGYECRYIYYCLKLFSILFWVSFVITVLGEILTNYFKLDAFQSTIVLGIRITCIAFIGLLYLLIRITNNPSINGMSGVWRRYKEINKLHINWIDEHIKTIKDFDKVDKYPK